MPLTVIAMLSATFLAAVWPSHPPKPPMENTGPYMPMFRGEGNVRAPLGEIESVIDVRSPVDIHEEYTQIAEVIR